MAYDLDKVIAERETEGEPFEFTFDGVNYTLPPDIDVLILNKFVEGDLSTGMAMLLGDQWQQILDAPKILGAAALGDLFKAYMLHLGADGLGESLASSNSLNRTARRSKPTSKGSTKPVSRSSVVR